MNAPVSEHIIAPDELIDLERRVFDAEAAERMYWRIIEDLFSHSHMPQDSDEVRSTARAMFRAPSAPASGLNVVGRAANELTLFPPSIAILAGICWRQFGFEPDFASVTLFANGDEYLSWHTDHDAMLGPEPGVARLVTFSFGATRRLDFARIGTPIQGHDPIAIEASFQIPGGSAYVMHPAVQRYYMHAVPQMSPQRRARLSVSFFMGQRGRPAEVWWTLVDARASTRNPPVFAGPATEAFERLCRSEIPLQAVTPLGITDSRYGAADHLKRMGLFTEEQHALLSFVRSSSMPAQGKPTAQLEDEVRTEMICTAETLLASVRCSRCDHIAGTLRLTEDAHDQICTKVPKGDTIRLCIECVQALLGRPLEPSELSIDPRNRPVLAAFVLGCEHIGLETRRAAALERLAEIDAASA
jgi:alkylated DNA repair dioxygenase AlkB